MTFQTTDAGDIVQRINGPESEARTGNSGYELVYARPLGALRTATVDGNTVTYETDPFGRRVGRRVNGGARTGYVYSSGLQIVAEVDPSTGARTVFIYGTRSNVPEMMIKGGTTYYRFITDHLGSVRLVVNMSTGEVAQRLDYDAWGRVLADTNPGFQPFGFAGGLYDPVTGLVRFGARDYDAETGRWTARDPIGLASGGSVYVYCNNDPINFVDRTGRDKEGAGIGAFIGGAIGMRVGAVLGAASGLVVGIPTGPGEVATIPAGTILGAAAGTAAGAGIGAAVGSWIQDLIRAKPANDNAEPKADSCVAGASCKGPSGPKSRGWCHLERDLLEVGAGQHFCQYYCPQDNSRPTIPLPTAVTCPPGIGFGSGGG